MPIFEYLCEDCGTKFERLVRRAGDSGGECPSCGKTHLATQLSTFAAHANGSPKSAPMSGGCPSGMCRTPDLCGRN